MPDKFHNFSSRIVKFVFIYNKNLVKNDRTL
ncbi:unknown [[Mannheimia] succiniciproducens MBEL55E]|uniref:Uncharacterized protein n=1 Tax=Mannheimia succiniciproducens (strain KCTC 0769BP / MBEL55E) TaxID=221988 RepID=Q65WL0_MANSM|nr:unknown [[Mannheimia] succiniciproducens MBEL55E]